MQTNCFFYQEFRDFVKMTLIRVSINDCDSSRVVLWNYDIINLQWNLLKQHWAPFSNSPGDFL